MEELDRRILAFMGAHRFVLVPQIAGYLEIDEVVVGEQLKMLEGRRMARSERVGAGLEVLWRVTAGGLRLIASRMTPPDFDLARYRHEVGVVWLWVAAWQSVFGEPERVLSKREMRSLDQTSVEGGGSDGRFSVPVKCRSTVESGALYPDVMLVFSGSRVAVHLFAWPYSSVDLNTLFSGHARRPEAADMVLVFVDDKRVGKRVAEAAERHGVRDRVRCHLIAGQGTALPAGPG